MTFWEKIFATSKTETRLIFKICYELLEINKETIETQEIHRRGNINGY